MQPLSSTLNPLPPADEERAQELARSLAAANLRAGQQYLAAAARVTGWTPLLRRANTLRCRWHRLQGEYRYRQQEGRWQS